MYSICLHTVSYLRRYCSHVSNFLRSGRADEGWFLLFGVPNAKYLAFGTPDESALRELFFVFGVEYVPNILAFGTYPTSIVGALMKCTQTLKMNVIAHSGTQVRGPLQRI